MVDTIADALYAQLTGNAEFIALVDADNILIQEIIPDEWNYEEHSPIILIDNIERSAQEETAGIDNKIYYIRVYGLDQYIIDSVTKLARKLLNRYRATTQNEGHILTTIASVTSAPSDDPNVVGRLISISLKIEE